MIDTLLLTRSDVARLLPISDAIAAVSAALRAEAEGGVLASQVIGLHAPAGSLHVKAAGWRRDGLYLAAKINANFPANAQRGLPAIQGLVALLSGEDGRLLAVLDSMELTAVRTAAATGVAARHLARADASTLAICGCGAQAAHQVRAVASVLGIRRVIAFDRDRPRAERWAGDLRGSTGLPVEIVGDARTAARDADVLVTCTPSTEPILGVSDVRAGVFVAGVGADHPGKHELEPGLLAAGLLVVDSLEQAAAMGDLRHALQAGVLRREDVHAELGEVVCGRKRGRRSPDEVIVFDSTGVAIEDVAASALAYERALASGLGRTIRFGG
jgi:ornithine cyclodeaminase/alanine dehydrogenase-like protein (mu-crystallin family)